MFGSKILDVAIGIIVLYILISILCSAIREGIEALLKTRGAYLKDGIRELLQDPTAQGLAKSLFDHPLIYGLYEGEYSAEQPAKRFGLFARGGKLPSYIPSQNFALALMEMAVRGRETNTTNSKPNAPLISLDNIRNEIGNLDNPPVQRAILTIIDSAQGDLNVAQKKIEAWYDSAMEHVSGQYKRTTHLYLFLISLSVAVMLNINTVTIADYLYRNDAARAALVAKATEAVKQNPPATASYSEAMKEIEEMKLPIGWPAWPKPKNLDLGFALPLLFGWLLTAFAATLGAPFWFDLLNKVVMLRSAVKPQEKGQAEATESRPPPVTASSAQSGTNTSVPIGDDNKTDGCDVAVTDATADQDLPAAEGGVA